MKILILGVAALAASVIGASMAPGDLSAQVIEDEMQPESGQYKANVSFVSLDLPDAPPEVANMMGQMMGRDFEYCMTPEDVAEGYRSMTDRAQQGECTYQRFRASGGEIEAEITCNVDGRAMTMEMQGTGSSTSSDITMTMSGDFGIGPGTMTMRIVQERIGDCS